MDIKNMTIQDIIQYCQEHDEVEWLKEIATRKVEYKIYPRKKVQKTIDGVAIFEKGKPVMVSISDKSQEPKIELRPISFVQIKTEFLEKFKLGTPKKEKTPSMYDLIANL